LAQAAKIITEAPGRRTRHGYRRIEHSVTRWPAPLYVEVAPASRLEESVGDPTSLRLGFAGQFLGQIPDLVAVEGLVSAGRSVGGRA
jgi:hypothetical protein